MKRYYTITTYSEAYSGKKITTKHIIDITQIEDLVYYNPNSSAFVQFYIIFKNRDQKEKLYISKKEYTELSELLNEIEL
jgi:hypothetical protein